uniref:GYF domain-containing protein n=1 Tax=Bicosoecida sp. CB-2014 TaxID=1486930 RepID=A0A7S1GBE8_9STRA|mmetsp:Transcript_25305/g.88313  ORF Transcript_25305/g.88313 Transcript_25305/m.88313 type:complete len:1055 (+) Transcript_25305:299-3463(+)
MEADASRPQALGGAAGAPRTMGGRAAPSADLHLGPRWARQSGSFSPGRPMAGDTSGAAVVGAAGGAVGGSGVAGAPAGGVEFGATTEGLFNPSRARGGFSSQGSRRSGPSPTSHAGAGRVPDSLGGGGQQHSSGHRDRDRDRDREYSSRGGRDWVSWSSRDRDRDRGGRDTVGRDSVRAGDASREWASGHDSRSITSSGVGAEVRRDLGAGADRVGDRVGWGGRDKLRGSGGSSRREGATRSRDGPVVRIGHRYTADELLRLHKPTTMPSDLDVIDNVTTRDSLSPCLQQPLSSDELARLWNSTRGRGRGRGGRGRWDEDEAKVRDGASRRDPDDETFGGRSHGDGVRGQDTRDKDWETFGGDADGDDAGGAHDSWETFARQANEFEAMKATSTRPGDGTSGGAVAPGVVASDGFADTSVVEAGSPRQSGLGRVLGSGSPDKSRPAELDSGPIVWFYKDPQGRIQGGFSSGEMREWMQHGFFSQDLPVRSGTTGEFVPLARAFPDERSAFLTAIPVQSGSAPTSAPGAEPAMSLPARTSDLSRHAVVAAIPGDDVGRAQVAAPAQAQSAALGASEHEVRKNQELKAQLEQLIYREAQAHAAVLAGSDTARANAMWSRLQDLRRYHAQVAASLDVQLSALSGGSLTGTPVPTSVPSASQPARTSSASDSRAWSQGGAAPAALQEMGSQIKALLGVGGAGATRDTGVGAGGSTGRRAQQVALAAGAPPSETGASGGGDPAGTVVASAALPRASASSATPAARDAPVRKAPSDKMPSAWGVSSTLAPSLLEIQAEEARKREAAEADEAARRAAAPAPSAAHGVWGTGAPAQIKSLRGIQAEERARAAAAPSASAAGTSGQGTWSALAASKPARESDVAARRASGAPGMRAAKESPAASDSADMFWEYPTGAGSSSSQTRGRAAPPAATSSAASAPAPAAAAHGAPRESSTMPDASNAFGGSGMSDDLMRWCAGEMLKLIGSDDTTLMQFCMTLESAADVREYIREYMGSTPQVSAFASEFIKRRKAASGARAPVSGSVVAKPQTAASSRRKRGKKRG